MQGKQSILGFSFPGRRPAQAAALVQVVVAATLLAMLSACASFGDPRLVEPTAGEPSGWLLLSMSVRYQKDDFPVPFNLHRLEFRDMVSGAVGGSFLYTGDFSERSLAKMDLVEDGLHVRVFATRLSPGEYEISSGYMGTDVGVAHHWIESKADLSIPFQVREGEITYVGNFDARVFEGRNRLGMRIRAGGAFVVGDHFDRDLDLAKARRSDPGFAEAPVFPQVPRLTGLAGGLFVSDQVLPVSESQPRRDAVPASD